ncbi:tyrosine-type recombinase/integrase [Pseudodesulfovibrio sp. JC047]|uniref:tyrosine-type recombinase/integrase n=1 Tax=Pseudodesulfovibrio sp. JC047 TaxID=2683199 RepID=UPI0013D01E56|nr:tyrosine-type recombinase/integrase [Pseudodesulfovibrio sp. JC047]NDV19234.1 tyrosine-type recombinase/integrase [Pseudodesulfovibrio sp. JC047]
MLQTNPMQGCRPLSGAEVISIAETFCRQERFRDICLFVLGVSCGFRVSEMLGLRVRDVFQDGEVLDWIIITEPKTGHVRQVELGEDDKAAIGAQVKALRLDGLYSDGTMLFRSRQGRNKAISRVRAWQIIRSTARGLGMDGKIGTHSMRKTFANNTYEAVLAMGKEDALRVTASAGGWRSVDACERYLSFRIEPQRKAKQVNTGQFGTLPEPGRVRV